MANLKDYISGLVASVTVARYNADVQSAEVARQYRADDILCNFSVPRMRIGDVEIEIPYALDHLNTQEGGPVELDKQTIRQALRRYLCKSYNINSIPNYNEDYYTGLNDSIDGTADEIIQGVNEYGLSFLGEGANNIYEDRVDYWMECMAQLEVDASPERNEVINNLRDGVNLVVQGPSQESSNNIDNLEVIAEADRLSAYDSRVITRLKIKIQEDGLVWANTANGEILVAE